MPKFKPGDVIVSDEPTRSVNKAVVERIRGDRYDLVVIEPRHDHNQNLSKGREYARHTYIVDSTYRKVASDFYYCTHLTDDELQARRTQVRSELMSIDAEIEARKASVKPGDVFVTDDDDSTFVRIEVIEQVCRKWKCRATTRYGNILHPHIFEDTLVHGGKYKKVSS